jgi:hypothetical protein
MSDWGLPERAHRNSCINSTRRSENKFSETVKLICSYNSGLNTVVAIHVYDLHIYFRHASTAIPVCRRLGRFESQKQAALLSKSGCWLNQLDCLTILASDMTGFAWSAFSFWQIGEPCLQGHGGEYEKTWLDIIDDRRSG